MMKKVCYYYRDHSGSAGFTLPDDKALLQRLFNPPVLPADEQLRGKRCWLYARVDGSQDNDSAVHALELQMDSLCEFAERYGMQVAGTTQEIAAGGNEDRAGLLELKHAAAAGKMNYVLVRSRDRLIRNPDLRLLLTYECGLQSFGVDILYMDSRPD